MKITSLKDIKTSTLATLDFRLWSHCRKTKTGCLEWRGKTNNEGYGLITVINSSGKQQGLLVHRLAVILIKGFNNKSLHHFKCGNKLCCNPNHLVEVHSAKHHKELERLRPNYKRGVFRPHIPVEGVANIFVLLNRGYSMDSISRGVVINRQTTRERVVRAASEAVFPDTISESPRVSDPAQPVV